MDTSDVAAVIPCYNSYTTVGNVVKNVKEYVSEVIVIDDGSQDQSAECARKSGATVISLDKNSGVGKATQTGLKVALEKQKKTVITLDADGAHNPSDILGLLRYHLSSRYALTIGNRWSAYDIRIPSQKWWANQFASALVNGVSSTNIPDVSCGFRVFNNKLAQQLVNNPMASGFGFIYQQIFLARETGEIGFSPIDVRYDANFLLATKQNELSHLLEISNQYCANAKIQIVIKGMLEKVAFLEKIYLMLKNSNDYIILFPLPDQQSYLFQWQHPDFIDKSTNFFEI